MNCIQIAIPDLKILESKVFGDSRGFFFESFNLRGFSKLSGIEAQFVQRNHSRLAKEVRRGLRPIPQSRVQGMWDLIRKSLARPSVAAGGSTGGSR